MNNFAQSYLIIFMKKIYTTILVLLSCYGISKAQSRSNTEFGIGFGLNSSYVTESSSNEQTDVINRFNVGISADHYFSDAWSLKVKAVYDQKGWANGFITFPSGTTINNVDFKLNYLTVPVMANWHFGRTRNWYLDFGPYVGFLLSASESSNNVDVKSIFNTVDGGLGLGIGIKLPVAQKTNIFIEYSGAAGIANIFKDSDTSILNATGSLNVGINF